MYYVLLELVHVLFFMIIILLLSQVFERTIVGHYPFNSSEFIVKLNLIVYYRLYFVNL